MKHKRIVGTILVILLGFMLASPVFADDPQVILKCKE